MRQSKSVVRSLMLITQLGLAVILPILFCIMAGYFIDRRFGTTWTIWFLILGFAAGGCNGYKTVKAVLVMNERDEEEQ